MFSNVQFEKGSAFLTYRCPLGGWVLILICFGVSGGCVERRLTVRTDPPGARVYIDDYEIGTSPCSTHFTYYGTRKIRLVKDGFRTKIIYQPLPPPWYQIPPMDFFAENLFPGTFRDHRTVRYELEPEIVIPAEELLRRADGVRTQALSEAGQYVVPVDRIAPHQDVSPGGQPGPWPGDAAGRLPGGREMPPQPLPVAAPPGVVPSPEQVYPQTGVPQGFPTGWEPAG
jgi:hypothetical protein